MAPASTKSNKRVKKPKKAAVEIGKDEDDDQRPGCVYLGHIPHGFYEKQMKQYFGQFGRVLDVRVCRSTKTSNSKGYGFVKFRYSAVAKTVAETCHNYLFLNKLMKCEYKPMSEIHANTFRKVVKPINVPKSQQNNSKSDLKLALSARTALTKAEKKLEKLKVSSGLNVDLSDIMDVPDVSKINGVISTERAKNVKSDKPEVIATPEVPSAKRKKTDPTSSSKSKATTPTPETPSAKRKKATPSKSEAVVTTPETPSAKRKKATPSKSEAVVTTPEAPSAKRKKATPSKSEAVVTAPETPSAKRKKATPSKSEAVTTTPEAPSAKRKRTGPSSTPVVQQATPVSGSASKTGKKTPKKSVVGVGESAAKVSSPKTPKSSPPKTRQSAIKKSEPKLKEKKSPKTPAMEDTPNTRKRKRV